MFSYIFTVIIRVFYKILKIKMGTAGFEPATSGTQSPNHTKLDYVPCVDRIMIPNFNYEIINLNSLSPNNIIGKAKKSRSHKV